MSGSVSVGEALCELYVMWIIFGDPTDRFVLGKLDL